MSETEPLSDHVYASLADNPVFVGGGSLGTGERLVEPRERGGDAIRPALT